VIFCNFGPRLQRQIIVGTLLSAAATLSFTTAAFAQVTITSITEIVDGALPDSGTQTSPWHIGGGLYIENGGALQIIEAGGRVEDKISSIAFNAGSVGTGTLTLLSGGVATSNEG